MIAHYRYFLCLSLLVLPLFLSLPSAAQNCDSISPYDKERILDRMRKGNLSFGLELFRGVNHMQKKNTNLCISPFSASMALSMTLNGAEGETLTQMTEALGFSGLTPDRISCAYRDIAERLEHSGTELQFQNANSIWIRSGLPVHDEFIAVNRSAYDAEVATLDFGDSEASETINDWVKEKTEGKISKIVPNKIGREVMMYLINAIYFKGMWSQKFDKEATEKEAFTLPGGKRIRHDLMKIEGEFTYTAMRDSAQIISLPYKTEKGKFAMIVILPPEGKEINDYIEGMEERSFSKITELIEGGGQSEGTLYLPKFKLEYEELLNEALIGMGMERAFVGSTDPEVNAEFGKISDRLLYISKVRQKTFVEVNEEGTEAAAVTAIEMAAPLSPEPARLPFVMRVDRPFLFLIVGADPDAILFFGKVTDPRGE